MEELLKHFDLRPFDVVMIFSCIPLFLVLWRSLERRLFAPYLAVVEAREALTTGAMESAQEATSRAAELTAQFDNQISAARIAAMKDKSEIVNKAKTEALAIVSKAEDEAQEFLRGIRWELAQRVESLKGSTFKDADVMAAALFDKITAPQSAPRLKKAEAHSAH